VYGRYAAHSGSMVDHSLTAVSWNWRRRVRWLCQPAILILIGATTLVTVALGDDTRIIGEARVIDGDTLDVGPVRIRLHGIDAPEAGQRCGKAVGGTWRCGDHATARLAELVGGKEIECAARDRDQYGRIIAVCYVDEAAVNEILVREGLAWAFTRYSEDYVAIEAEARLARIGVWQGEAETPWDYRANRWERAAAASPRPGCPIKGNINREGEKIYHTPWSPWYERTVIDESKGQRWFCDEAEAEAAGWRPARWR
jgi:endonuclease YncB( thermonuclease family)